MEKEEVQKIERFKFRVTPLNLITAICLVACGFFVLEGFEGQVNRNFNDLFFMLCILAAVVSFVSDLIFRRSIPILKNLWIVETALIVFTVVMILIIKTLVF
ncbi:hypothetical protein [Pedobacter sp.]|uniref:hypothetical protein n=1 Tax=Pedobacter sp. TaxID=1411316 RepID=UPI003D7FA249